MSDERVNWLIETPLDKRDKNGSEQRLRQLVLLCEERDVPYIECVNKGTLLDVLHLFIKGVGRDTMERLKQEAATRHDITLNYQRCRNFDGLFQWIENYNKKVPNKT
jgi:hypothetical protein